MRTLLIAWLLLLTAPTADAEICSAVHRCINQEEQEDPGPPQWWQLYPAARTDVVTISSTSTELVAAAALTLRQPEYLSLSAQPERISAAEFVSTETKYLTLEQLFGPSVRGLVASGDALDRAFVTALIAVQTRGTKRLIIQGLEATVTVDTFGRVGNKTLRSDAELRAKSRLVNLTRADREAFLRQVGVDNALWLGNQDDLSILRHFNAVETRRLFGGNGAASWNLPPVEIGGTCSESTCTEATSIGAAVAFSVQRDGAVMGPNGIWVRPSHELALKVFAESENKNWPGGSPEARLAGLTDPAAIALSQMANVPEGNLDLALRDVGAPADWLAKAPIADKRAVLAAVRVAAATVGSKTLTFDFVYDASVGSGDSAETVSVPHHIEIPLTITAPGKRNGKTLLIEMAVTAQMKMEFVAMALKRNLMTQAGFPFEAVRSVTPAEAAAVTARITLLLTVNGEHTFDFTAGGAKWMAGLKVAGNDLVGGTARKYPPEPKWYEELLGPVLTIVSIAFPPFQPFAAVINAGIAIDNGATGIRLIAAVASAAAGMSEIMDLSAANNGAVGLSDTTRTLKSIAGALTTASSLHSAVKAKDALGMFSAIVALADMVGGVLYENFGKRFNLIRTAGKVAGLISVAKQNPFAAGLQIVGALIERDRAVQQRALAPAQRPLDKVAPTKPETISWIAPDDAVTLEFAEAMHLAHDTARPVFTYDKVDGQGALLYATDPALDEIAALGRAAQYAPRSSYLGSDVTQALDVYGNANVATLEMQEALFATLVTQLEQATLSHAAERNALLNGVDQNTFGFDPLSRLGAYAATRGYAPGTLGYAVNVSIIEGYFQLGELGAEQMGEFYNSAEAKALYASPANPDTAYALAELERDFWIDRLPAFGALAETSMSAEEQATQWVDQADDALPPMRNVAAAPYVPPVIVAPDPRDEGNPRCRTCPLP